MTHQPFVRTLTGLTATMTVGEVISSVIIWREAYPDSQPLFAVAFAALFAVATVLLRTGRVPAGALLAEALCLFEVAAAPAWVHRTLLDWSTQLAFGTVALAGVVVAAAVLLIRLRAARARAAEQIDAGR